MQYNTIINGDSLEELKALPDDSVDVIVTDPPYGYSFMGKDWDKAVPPVELWKECLRVLKPGAFAFIMSAPRQDVLSQMIVRVAEAGFDTDFTSIYWTYASGFPKAANIGKLVDKRRWGGQTNEIRHYLRDVIRQSGVSHRAIKDHLGIDQKSGVVSNWTVTDSAASVPSSGDWLKLKQILPLDDRYDNLVLEVEREVVGHKQVMGKEVGIYGAYKGGPQDITLAETPQAKALDGSYAGFQPKPAVEVIIVAMKPLSENTFVDQALKNGHGITWLDDARIPTGDSTERPQGSMPQPMDWNHKGAQLSCDSDRGRFPANLLSDAEVLGDHSRYFDLDAWAEKLPPGAKEAFPFLVVPKASKGEKDKGLSSFPDREGGVKNSSGRGYSESDPHKKIIVKNAHTTVKPLKLMQYLITLGSRPGDVVLDPFSGSGTTCIAAKLLGRNYIGIELSLEYCQIAVSRIAAHKPDNTLFKAS